MNFINQFVGNITQNWEDFNKKPSIEKENIVLKSASTALSAKLLTKVGKTSPRMSSISGIMSGVMALAYFSSSRDVSQIKEATSTDKNEQKWGQTSKIDLEKEPQSFSQKTSLSKPDEMAPSLNGQVTNSEEQTESKQSSPVVQELKATLENKTEEIHSLKETNQQLTAKLNGSYVANKVMQSWLDHSNSKIKQLEQETKAQSFSSEPIVKTDSVVTNKKNESLSSPSLLRGLLINSSVQWQHAIITHQSAKSIFNQLPLTNSSKPENTQQVSLNTTTTSSNVSSDQQLLAQLNGALAANKIAQRQIKELTQNNRELADELKFEREQAVEAAQRSKQEAQQEKNQLKARIRDLSTEKDDLIEVNQQLDIKNKELIQTAASNKITIQRLKDRIEQLENSPFIEQPSKKEIKVTSNSINKSQQNETQQFREKNAELDERVKVLSQQNQQLSKQLARSKESEKKLESELYDLVDKQAKDQNVFNKERLEFQKEKAELTKQFEPLQDKVLDLTKDVQLLKQINAEAITTVEVLKEENESLKEQNESYSNTLKVAVEVAITMDTQIKEQNALIQNLNDKNHSLSQKLLQTNRELNNVKRSYYNFTMYATLGKGIKEACLQGDEKNSPINVEGDRLDFNSSIQSHQRTIDALID